MIDFLQNLDRRWIFLLMAIAVAVPVYFQPTFPETPTQLVKDTFDQIENLKEGDKVLLAWDFDPGSEGELGPMSKAFILHCAKKKLKMYFITLMPTGQQMIESDIEKIIKIDFPALVYGEDYVDLGFKPGGEGNVKVITTNLKELYTTDSAGTTIDQIPMLRDVDSIRDMKLIINVSSGTPGIKEWVQYAADPHDINMVAGCTGVQAPQMYPYIPEQLNGLLGAIKGAAEYETLVIAKHTDGNPRKIYRNGIKRMGPQLVAHLLMIALIIVGNIVYFTQRRRGKIS